MQVNVELNRANIEKAIKIAGGIAVGLFAIGIIKNITGFVLDRKQAKEVKRLKAKTEELEERVEKLEKKEK